MRLVSICSAVVLLAGTVARADEPPQPQPPPAAGWTRSFDTARVASYLPAAPASYMVVAGGAGSRGAAAALQAALRGMPVARVVMDDAAIGPVAELDDPSIVARAKALPVDAIAVVRVFPAGDGQAPRAVVTFYAKDATMKAAFTCAAGTPLEPRPADDGAPTEGLTGPTVEAISSVLHDRADPKAREAYDSDYIGLVDGYMTRDGQVQAGVIGYQGKQRRPLEQAVLLRAVGRYDLASAIEARQKTRLLLALVGGATVTVGLGVTVASFDCQKPLFEGDPVTRKCNTSAQRAGLAMIGGGVVMAAIALAIGPRTVPAEEVRVAVEEHNRRLRQRLGLTAMPAVTTSGAGVVLGGVFP